MSKPSFKEFQRDVEMRQRNIVYPDTLRNEIRGWRELITSKEPLSVVQVVGILVLYVSILGLLFVMGYSAFEQFHRTPGIGLNRIVAGFGPYAIIVVVCGAVFLLLRWRVRKALIAAHKDDRLSRNSSN